MSVEFTIKYVWRALNEDGLLKLPKAIGPYYDVDDKLRCGAWDTEAEAIEAFRAFFSKHGKRADRELTLVCIWEPEDL